MTNERKVEKYGIVKSTVLQDPALSVTAKTVYALLCTFANKQRECYPSITHLSELLGVNRRTVERAIAELKKESYVSKKGRLFTVK